MVPEVKEETAMLLIMGRLLPLRKTITFAFLYRASLSFILNCPYKWSHYFIYESRTNKHKSSYGDKYAIRSRYKLEGSIPQKNQVGLLKKCCGKEIVWQNNFISFNPLHSSTHITWLADLSLQDKKVLFAAIRGSNLEPKAFDEDRFSCWKSKCVYPLWAAVNSILYLLHDRFLDLITTGCCSQIPCS